MLSDGSNLELNVIDKGFVADLLAAEFLRFMTDNEGRVIKYEDKTYVVWKDTIYPNTTEPEKVLNYNEWDDPNIKLIYWCGGDIFNEPDDGSKVWVYLADSEI